MKIKEICKVLEDIAPASFAEDWDNVGLLVGDAEASTDRLMLCIDLSEEVIAEARQAKAGMLMCYHPPIFKPLSRVTADACPLVFKALKSNIAIYSMHTSFDVVPGGSNDVLARAMGLKKAQPIEDYCGQSLVKIAVYTPPDELSRVANAAFVAGAGRLGNYYDCAFFSHGIGTFCPNPQARPTVGSADKHEAVEEVKLEFIAPLALAGHVCSALRETHSYEEPAIDVVPMRQFPKGTGMGRIGRLERPVRLSTLLTKVKKATGVSHLLLAGAAKKDIKISTVACGAGSCGSLYKKALANGAEFYLTGEMRHHDALAASKMVVACVGHSNSERLSLDDLAKRLTRMLKGLKTQVSRRDHDPFVIS